jgi:hypothetical protein
MNRYKKRRGFEGGSAPLSYSRPAHYRAQFAAKPAVGIGAFSALPTDRVISIQRFKTAKSITWDERTSMTDTQLTACLSPHLVRHLTPPHPRLSLYGGLTKNFCHF